MKAIYDKFLKYFQIEEVITPACMNQFGQYGDYYILSRFDPRLLEVMIFIREKIGKPITINDWFWGGKFDERGLRDNLCPIVKGKKTVYLSGHALGSAFDFDVEGMTASEVRDWLDIHSTKLPHRIRLENELRGKQISWVHLDVIDDPKNPKVYRFNI